VAQTVMMYDIFIRMIQLWEFCILLHCKDMLWGAWLVQHWYL